jgi:NitT/TauT family transport system substrate-binding protein
VCDRIRQYILLPLLGLIAIALSGCHEETSQLRVGTNMWIGYEPLYMARELGYYRDTSIKLIEMNNATEVSSALRAGLLDAAALTLDEALTVKQDAPDLQVVLVMDSSAGADILLGQPEIADLPDLRGKRIGVETTAVGAILLQAALEKAQLSVQDVEIVSLPVDEHLEAFESKRIDAVVTFDPVRSRLLQLGAHPLFDSRAIPNRIIDVLVIHQSTAEQHGKQLRKLIEGHFAALAYFAQHPADAKNSVAARIKTTPAQVADMLGGIHIQDRSENIALLSGTPSPLNRLAEQIADVMTSNKMLSKMVELHNLSDPRWVKQP